ncbi:Glycosyltransferase involved in cell wall bisynthesis [Chitinophaga sp. YR573]|uniref:glycosyltransferase family 2 protein n=1 Tax=Chitinophaga sp. YR573 TaxID=1881040 RepID=UPI0008C71D32|nr:glycosyltransferase family 2 protein [Chitinophaga sp. YR573]SEW14450.1 Glycosyltransferase involved in cell wall bisynthesis [Chitinophaga sp. YR573]
MSKVSIITVVYNGATSLANTIESVVAQTYADIEYIIIDGGSTDGTIDVIRQYEKSVSIWRSEKDKGVYDAMNKGAALATGEWLFFLNSGDCLIDKDTLRNFFRQESLFQNASIAYGDIQLTYPKHIVLKQCERNPKYESICHQAQFIKRSYFLEQNGFNLSYKIYGDFDFQRRAYLKSKDQLYYVPVVIATYENVGLSSKPFYHYLKEYIRVGKNNHVSGAELLRYYFYGVSMSALTFVLTRILKK